MSEIKKSDDQTFDQGFPHAKPRCWRSKSQPEAGLFKVLPWYQPIGDESRIDFKGIFKDLFPEMTEDVMSGAHIYSGLVLQVGFMVEGSNGVWIGVGDPAFCKEQFEDLGAWDEEKHRPEAKKIDCKEGKE